MEESLGGVAEKRLYDAAAVGDTKSLHELLKEDPLLLERVSFTSPNKTPLHVATMKGHLAFVQEILNHNPQIAEELDAQQSSPLHIASAKGYLEIVRKLLSAAPDMCLSRDCQGRNPLHLAAMKGHIEVLAELIRAAPVAAREKVDRGLILLHLCVKHYQLDALKILLPNLNEFLNAKDDDGETILHMAVRDKQTEIIEYLVGNTKIDVNAKNSNGQTAINILKQSQPEERNLRIRSILRLKRWNYNKTQTQRVNWLTKKGDAIMVMAVLIATMTFQAGVNPAGGIWQDNLTQDLHGNPAIKPHRAGEAIMAYNHPEAYKNFIRSNTIAFVSSVTTILLLISGLPFRGRLFMWILMVIMWLTVTSLSVSYAISVVVVTPKYDGESLVRVLKNGLGVWFGVMGILLLGNRLRQLERLLKEKGLTEWPPRRCKNIAEVKNTSQEIV
ncbi:hypothetical protein BUALT_Bualt10G0129600 [Buddleja alternifolia]|uniref:PGG domain-containing protein n=1 Tax=Buddleja alternifolia TaxID=168488 RepID=A0AAV6WZH0_9LAMI|nr:hypothetical protein BUALT_Bualt10G0129600 [Buddleja alternifolia]